MLRKALAAVLFSAAVSVAVPANADEPLTIGFLVKRPDLAWFQDAQAAARALGAEQNFKVIDIGVTDGEKALAAIDALNAAGAMGFIVCPPDVRLGPAILAKARATGMKVVAVDNRLLGRDGKPLEGVPFLGISGHDAGVEVGQALLLEMQRRGWTPADTAALRLVTATLPTAVERVDGTREALLAGGFLPQAIVDAAQKSTDGESGHAAAKAIFAAHDKVDHWLIFGPTEESVIGAVRASEEAKLDADDVLAIGIDGSAPAFAEFARPQSSGFYATLAFSAQRHGRESAANLVRWIREGVEPPAVTTTEGTLVTRETWQQQRP